MKQKAFFIISKGLSVTKNQLRPEITRLRCNFREFLDKALQDRFARGLINSSKRQRLLAERALALKTAIDLAKTLESAENETKLIFTDIKTENPFIIK